MEIKNALILLFDENAFIPVFKVPVIKRIFIILRSLGIEGVFVIGRAELYKKLIREVRETFVFFPAEQKHEIKGLLKKGLLRGDTLILKANSVIDRASLLKLIENYPKKRTILVGKRNNSVFLCPEDQVEKTICEIWEKKETDACRIEGIAGLPYLIEDEKEIKEAEDLLIKSLSLQTRAQDSLLARYFDRNISLFFSKRLVRTKITPNQITLFGMSIGITGAILLSFPSYWLQLIGAFLFLFCVIIDGMDGEVARLKLKESRFGHYLDIITDNIVHVCIFVGIGYGLYRKTGNELYKDLIFILLIGFGLCAISVYQCVLKRSEEEIRRSPLLLRLMSLVTNRDFAYVIALLAIFDKLNWFFIATSIGTYIFAAVLWIIYYRYKKTISHKPP